MNERIKSSLASLWKATRVTLVLLVLCGLIYPVLMSGVSKLVFPYQSGGNLIMAGGKAVGSEFVGQDFTDPRYMKSRPSAVNYNTYTAEQKANGEYGGLASGSNNYAPTNPALVERVTADIKEFLAANPDVKQEDIPTDLLTASGSGLDPHISLESAAVQIPALVGTTGLDEAVLQQIVKDNSQGKVLGIFGENRVNVLGVNLDIAGKLGLIAE